VFVLVQPWRPAGVPVAFYDTRVGAQQAAAELAAAGIPGKDLCVLSLHGWHSGDRGAVLLGGYVALLGGMLLAFEIARPEPFDWLALLVVAGALVVGVGLWFMVRALSRWEQRRFVAGFGQPVTGPHVLFCASESVRQANSLLGRDNPNH
jgi:hypothetical protein